MWRYLWLLLTYLVISLLPLVTSIGRNLEYEYALSVSILSLIIIPLLAVFFPRKYIPVYGPEFRPPLSFEIIWIFFLSPLILILPGSVMFATDLCPCSYTGFYFWIAVQALPTWYLAHVLYYWVLKLRHEGLKRNQCAAGLVTIWSVVALFIVSVLWFMPQKRVLSVFVGYLHGPIYDDWIPVDHGIFFSRMAHVFIAFTLMSLVWLRKKKPYYIVSGALAVVSVFLVFVASTFDSTGNGKRILDENFTHTLTHDALTLHYVNPAVQSNEPPTDEVPSRVKLLFKDAVFHYEDLSSIFSVKGESVDVYLYPNQEKKKLWFGGGSTDVTDVRTPSIHITFSGWPHPTLRHEMVHALSSYFAYYGLGFHPNMALTEGLAVALAPNAYSQSLDEAAASLMKQNRLPNLDNLFSFLFWKEAGRRAYTTSGSIINFLVREKGFRVVKDLYSGTSWEKAVGEKKEETLERWKEFIKKKSEELPDNLAAERLYRYSGIINDLCPHSKADLSQPRNQNQYTRLRQPIGWDPKKDYLLWRASLEPNNFNIRFRLWRRQIAKEAGERVIKRGRLITWIKTLENSRNFPPKKIEDVESAILQSDIERVTYGFPEGNDLLQKLLEVVTEKTIGESMIRQIYSRLLVDEVVSEGQTIAWRKYLAGWGQIPKPRTQDEVWLLTYLRVRRGSQIDKSTIKRARKLSPPENLPATFKVEWFKYLGHRMYQMKMYDEASSAYNSSAKYATEGKSESLRLWARKAAFFGEKKRNIN